MRKASFKVRIRELMRQEGLQLGEVVTQTAREKATGLSYPTVQRLYRGSVKRLEAETIQRLTEHFGCTVADLIEVE